MADCGGDPSRVQPACHLLGDGDGTVMASSATHADGDVGFAFGFVTRDQERHQLVDAIEELLGIRAVEHIVRDG
jgi:hypothetical protein